jgi:hypothetical protein
MKYVLILYLLNPVSHTTSVSMAEFDTKKACMVAGRWAQALSQSKFNRGGFEIMDTKAICVPKGDSEDIGHIEWNQ